MMESHPTGAERDRDARLAVAPPGWHFLRAPPPECTMEDGLLYQRPLPHGPVVRIRRTSERGAMPVTAVLEVERRAGTPRASTGVPPALVLCEAASESEALACLEIEARSDAAVARMMRDQGLR